jgi:geranylgeranyl diphosphate synthase type I
MSGQKAQTFISHWLPKLERELRTQLTNEEEALAGFYGMMRYHMGWVDETFQPKLAPAGKRLRPMLCLMACDEVGGDPVQAMAAAAAIELIHNFSLIHDDVEDGDETRRHRPTVWKLWGVPQAINTGDGMFSIAYRAIQRTARLGVPDKTVLTILNIFTATNVQLTEGQYLDMSFEAREVVGVDEYMRMISGKTSALIEASVAIGASIGGAAADQYAALGQFGRAIGLAFQVQDDILGVWGDPKVTGKAAGNDILRRKKSLPLLYALNHGQTAPRLRALMADEITPDQLPQVLALLEQAGAREYAEAIVARQYEVGLRALEEALGERATDSALYELANSLLGRRS